MKKQLAPASTKSGLGPTLRLLNFATMVKTSVGTFNWKALVFGREKKKLLREQATTNPQPVQNLLQTLVNEQVVYLTHFAQEQYDEKLPAVPDFLLLRRLVLTLIKTFKHYKPLICLE